MTPELRRVRVLTAGAAAAHQFPPAQLAINVLLASKLKLPGAKQPLGSALRRRVWCHQMLTLRSLQVMTYAGFFFGLDHLRPTAFLGLGLLAAFELEERKS